MFVYMYIYWERVGRERERKTVNFLQHRRETDSSIFTQFWFKYVHVFNNIEHSLFKHTTNRIITIHTHTHTHIYIGRSTKRFNQKTTGRFFCCRWSHVYVLKPKNLFNSFDIKRIKRGFHIQAFFALLLIIRRVK